jgi:hypothetical protein
MALAYVTGVLGRIFAVRWIVFKLAALGDVREEIAETRRIVGRRLVYLSLIPGSPRTFSAAERDFLAAFVRDLLVHDCESIHHVIDGSGFEASARRSIVTNLAVASARPDAFHTYATLEEALEAISLEVGGSPALLEAEAAERGLVFPRP